MIFLTCRSINSIKVEQKLHSKSSVLNLVLAWGACPLGFEPGHHDFKHPNQKMTTIQIINMPKKQAEYSTMVSDTNLNMFYNALYIVSFCILILRAPINLNQLFYFCVVISNLSWIEILLQFACCMIGYLCLLITLYTLGLTLLSFLGQLSLHFWLNIVFIFGIVSHIMTVFKVDNDFWGQL